jgi:hypothetical protein
LTLHFGEPLSKIAFKFQRAPLQRGPRICDREHDARAESHAHGKAVQVHPIKPTSKALGTKRLKLDYDEPLSNFALTLNLRRSTMAAALRCLADLDATFGTSGIYLSPLNQPTKH